MIYCDAKSRKRLKGFYDLAGLKAFDADADPLRGAVHNGPDGLQIRQKTTRGYAGYLPADAAFFLGKAPPDDSPSGNRFLTADQAYI